MTEFSLLGRREAHLHILRLQNFADEPEEALMARFGGLLSQDERERVERPTLQKRRREILLTRMLVRTRLSLYAEIDPKDWRFGVGERGRPFIADPIPSSFIDFNLTHTEGMILCLVAPVAGIGVDVEYLPRRNDTAAIASHFFAPPEQADLGDRFFTYWTLKEAYIKARGKGLALPLDGFWFDLSGEEPTISFDERIDDDPALWRFQSLELSSDHLCSVALPIGPGAKPDLRLFEV